MKINKTVLEILFLGEKHFNINTFYGVNNTIENNINFYSNKVDKLRGLLNQIKKGNFVNRHDRNIYIYDYDCRILHTLNDINYVDSYVNKNNIKNYVCSNYQSIKILKNNTFKDSYIYMNKNQLMEEIKRELKNCILQLKKYKALKKLEFLSGKILSIEEYNKILPSICKKANIKYLVDVNFKIVSKENKLFSIDYKY